MQIELKTIILDFIEDNYGKEERENPCYNIDELTKIIMEFLDWRYLTNE